jgi:antitoxin ParD1/3/4
MASKAVTVTLGKMAERAEAHIASGKYSTMSEVVREGLRALDRQEAMLDAIYKAKIEEALANPAPAVPLAEGLARVRERIAASRRE